MKKNNTKYSYEEIVSLFIQHGCKIMEFKSCHLKSKIKYTCKCGSICTKSLSAFIKSNNCDNCRPKFFKTSPNRRVTIEKISTLCKKYGCKLLSNNYYDNRQLLNFICSCGNHFSKNIESFKLAPRCKKCTFEHRKSINSGSKNPNWNPNRDIVKNNKKFKIKAHNMLKQCFKNLKLNKENDTVVLLGYSIKDLINHIENDKNWPLLKNNKWHIDHIFPIKAFLDYGITDLKIVNALDNLRPISPEENYKKYYNYSIKEFEAWLLSKNVKFESQIKKTGVDMLRQIAVDELDETTKREILLGEGQ